VGKRLLEGGCLNFSSRSLIQLCPYFTYWRGLGLRPLFFFIYWVKTINFIECIANYPYPSFFSSTLLSLYSGKRKALRKTHHPRLPKRDNGGGGKMRLGLGLLWVWSKYSALITCAVGD
jgi:hypothetical protein